MFVLKTVAPKIVGKVFFSDGGYGCLNLVEYGRTLNECTFVVTKRVTPISKLTNNFLAFTTLCTC